MSVSRRGDVRAWARRHPRAVDVGATVAVGAVVALMIRESDVFLSRPANGCAYALGVLMTLPLVAWRRRPLTVMLLSVAVLLVYYLSGFPGISPITVLALPLYRAAVTGRAAWGGGIVAALFTAGYVSVGFVRDFRPLETFALYVTHAAFGAVVVLLAEVVRGRRALAARARDEREREVARKVAEERTRIARELHDTVAHSMATIAVQAGSALHVPGDARSALAAIRGTSREALREMRAAVGTLRGGPAADTAGMERLPALLDAVRSAGVPVDLEVEGNVRPLGRAGHAAYRIVQEALTNVLRHAGPDVRATVRLAYAADGVTIEVLDDGTGGPAGGPGGGPGGGHGLSGMRERAEASGGTFAAGPRPGGGFAVTARLRDGA